MGKLHYLTWRAQQQRRLGRRHAAFVRGYHAFRRGEQDNPFCAGTEEHECWRKGRRWAEEEKQL
jgi:hypothetical protein